MFDTSTGRDISTESIKAWSPRFEECFATCSTIRQRLVLRRFRQKFHHLDLESFIHLFDIFINEEVHRFDVKGRIQIQELQRLAEDAWKLSEEEKTCRMPSVKDLGFFRFRQLFYLYINRIVVVEFRV